MKVRYSDVSLIQMLVVQIPTVLAFKTKAMLSPEVASNSYFTLLKRPTPIGGRNLSRLDMSKFYDKFNKYFFVINTKLSLSK